MRMGEARGTALDYIYRPKFRGVKGRFVRFR